MTPSNHHDYKALARSEDPNLAADDTGTPFNPLPRSESEAQSLPPRVVSTTIGPVRVHAYPQHVELERWYTTNGVPGELGERLTLNYDDLERLLHFLERNRRFGRKP